MNNLKIVIFCIFFGNGSITLNNGNSEFFSAFYDVAVCFVFLHQSEVCLIFGNIKEILNIEVCTFCDAEAVDGVSVCADSHAVFKVSVNTESIGFGRHGSYGFVCFYGSKEIGKFRVVINKVNVKVIFVCEILVYNEVSVLCKHVVVGDRFDIACDCLKLIEEGGVNKLLELREVRSEFICDGKEVALFIEVVIHFAVSDHDDIDRRSCFGIKRFDLTVFVNGCFFCRINFTGGECRSYDARYLLCPLAGILFLLAGKQLFSSVRFFLCERIVLVDRSELGSVIIRFSGSFFNQFDVLFCGHESHFNFCFESGFCELVDRIFNVLRCFGCYRVSDEKHVDSSGQDVIRGDHGSFAATHHQKRACEHGKTQNETY